MTTEPPTATGDRAGAMQVARVERWLAPLKRFLHIESASGIVLLVCTTLASPYAKRCSASRSERNKR
jgi:hypothetical protein